MPPLLLASRVRSLSWLRSCFAQHRHFFSRRRSFCSAQICAQRRNSHAVAAARFDPNSTPPPAPLSTSFSSTPSTLLPPPPPPTSAYVHLPFCVKKCFYCDFPVRALGEAGAQSLLPNGRGKESSRSLPEGVAAYLETLLSDIDATSAVRGSSPLLLPPLQTISFGGGTPSLLPPAEIERLISALAEKFGGLAEGAEISLEADPGTFDADSLRGYVEAGVTRLSIGVQSFDEGILRGCGRSHGLEDVERALELVSEARRRDSRSKSTSGPGLRSWSLDLVAGLPGLDLPIWKETLRRAVAADPDHISVYDLQLEAGTPFGDAASRLESAAAAIDETTKAAAAAAENSGKPFTLPGPLPLEDEAARMLREASRVLRDAGYSRYEVSNYSRPEKRRRGEGGGGGRGGGGGKGTEEELVEAHESRHNRVYWRGDEDYYAFGLGASSRLRGVRVTRPRSMRGYSRFVEELAGRGDGVPREEDGSPKASVSTSSSSRVTPPPAAAAAASPASPQLTPTPRDVLLEVSMLRLRTRDGLDLGEVAARWGEAEARAIGEALVPSVAAGFAAEEGGRFSSPSSSSSSSPWPVVRLTDPEGFLVSNSVISDVFVGLDGVAEE